MGVSSRRHVSRVVNVFRTFVKVWQGDDPGRSGGEREEGEAGEGGTIVKIPVLSSS